MRKSFIIACALLMALPALPMPEVEAGRFVARRVSRSFNQGYNQASRNFRQTSRAVGRAYRAPVRRAPVRYSSGYRNSAFRGSSFGRGVYLGSGRSGIYLNF